MENTVVPNALRCSLAVLVLTSTLAADDPIRGTIDVPGYWEDERDELASHDGFVWYRSKVRLPAGWRGERIELRVEKVSDAHVAYVNGHEVGVAGAFPPNAASGVAQPQRYVVNPAFLRFGESNVIAVRIHDANGKGGFGGSAPAIVGEKQGIWLSGTWEFTTEGDPKWAAAQGSDVSDVTLRVVSLPAFKFREVASTGDDVLPPRESIAKMTLTGDIVVEPVLAEPVVKQPVAMHFDTRGRLWVVNYEQYPNPAGLKMLSRDKHWRAVYDKVPQPPPHGVKGRDRITVHWDTDRGGVGDFDQTRVFLDDLNIATAVAVGRGGVWVLNPPYLLFYADANGDDVPDGDPEVRLEGFGIEDTHSSANSLTWGPDGWLYGAQGSTVSGNVRRPGERQGVFSMGQNIWRYHPESQVYEVFAEGGGNAYGIAFDAEGRVFSGHNGGNTRGFHYVQGGYYRKGFGKHGPLSNPHAYGYFEDMQHPDVERFAHDFVVYEEMGTTAGLDDWVGNLLGVEPLQGRIVRAEMSVDGSTFRTRDLDRPVVSREKRFRPVNIEIGPNGYVYVADFHEPQISHREHFAGIVENETGRIYRIRGKQGDDLVPTGSYRFHEISPEKLVDQLSGRSPFVRGLVLRAITDRATPRAFIPLLEQRLRDETGTTKDGWDGMLPRLWSLHQVGGLDEAFAVELLDHPVMKLPDFASHDGDVLREWIVRLACDDREVSSTFARRLVAMARRENSVRVRSQLASSARRLPTEHCLPIVRTLLERDEDAGDPHLPLLLWWAIESKCGTDPENVVALFEEEELWSHRIVQEAILARLMRRLAEPGTQDGLKLCARLLDASPNEASTKPLMAGFEAAFRGRALGGLPAELVTALAKAGGGSPSLRMRQGDAKAIDEALRVVVDESVKASERVTLIATLGEIREPRAVDVLLEVLKTSKDATVRMACLGALQSFDEPRIGSAIVARVPRSAAEETDDVAGANDERNLALELITSRSVWSDALVDAVEEGRIEKASIPVPVVRKLTLHRDAALVERVGELWADVRGATSTEMQAEVNRLREIVDAGNGDPYGGKRLYSNSCGKCHQLFGDGGRIGPDLTPYQRKDTTNLIVNVVNPSAEVRKGFESYAVITDEGRIVTGFLSERSDQIVVLRTAEGQEVRIPTAAIDEMVRQEKSLMPERLLDGLTDQQVRDLFAYLRSSQPIN